MEIRRDFEVKAPPGQVFEMLIDLERVGGCIPGGRVGPAEGDAHPASIAVRLGPMKFDYQGTVKVVEAADPERRAVLSAQVRERRGQGTANALMTMVVAEKDDDAHAWVESVTELKLTGRAAQMGRGVVDDVAERLVGEMAECVSARLAPPPAGNGSAAAAPEAEAAARPVRGVRLGLAVLWMRIKRLLASLRRTIVKAIKGSGGSDDD